MRRFAWIIGGLGCVAVIGCNAVVEAPLGEVPESTTSSGSTGGSTGTAAPLCSPCDQSSDCGPNSVCTRDPSLAGNACAPICSTDLDCTAGTHCAQGASGVHMCWPNSGQCAEPADAGGATSTSANSTSASSGSIGSSAASSSASSGSSTGTSSTSGSTGRSTSTTSSTSTATSSASSTSGSTGTTTSSTSSTGTTTSSTSSTGTTTSSTSSTLGTSGSSGSTGIVGPNGGTVDLMKFAISGDTRPPSCGDTANYPKAVINGIATAAKTAGAQFALDLGDHMYVCNNSASVAQAQMQLYMNGVAHFGGTWFLTEGNHECMGAGSGFCGANSTNVNYQAFLSALAPIANKPYYKVNVHTSLGLATFVFIADNSWDTAQQTWLENVLTTADANATYTIISKHHPEGDTSIASNPHIMQIIRNHKFSLLLTGHAHEYTHQTADNGRDLILGLGGAPFSGSGSYHGYGIIEQRPNGKLRVNIYDLANGTLQDQWSVNPN